MVILQRYPVRLEPVTEPQISRTHIQQRRGFVSIATSFVEIV